MASNPIPQSVPDTAGAASRAPRPLLAAAAIVAVESAVALGYAVWLLAEAFVGTPRERGQAVAVAVTFLILAAPFPWVARGLARARMRARTPAVMLQLLALWVAYFMVKAGFWIGAVPTVLCAVAGLAGVFTPASTAALTRDWRQE
jgi:hypothetical protein